jgi:hypothetical protein
MVPLGAVMPYRLLLLVLVCARIATAASSGAESSGDGKWEMRWRTCADYVSGYSFRYPYAYHIPDQYATELMRERHRKGAVVREVTVEGKRAFVLDESKAGPAGVDVKGFSFLASALPAGIAATPEAIGAHMAADPRLALPDDDRTLAWKSFDYYQRPDVRPQADAKMGDSRAGCGTGRRQGGLRAGGAAR